LNQNTKKHFTIFTTAIHSHQKSVDYWRKIISLFKKKLNRNLTFQLEKKKIVSSLNKRKITFSIIVISNCTWI